VSDSSFTANSRVFFGDYSNIAALGGKVYPIWTRVDGTKRSTWLAIITDAATSVAKTRVSRPRSFMLLQNYPNPFNPESVIRYSIPSQGQVQLVVHNILGETVRTLVDRMESAGEHSVRLSMQGMPGGTYFYSLSHGGHTRTRRMIYIR
jgi:hypothetical protein